MLAPHVDVSGQTNSNVPRFDNRPDRPLKSAPKKVHTALSHAPPSAVRPDSMVASAPRTIGGFKCPM